MPGLRPILRIAVLTPDSERFRGALTLAAAQAALGGDVGMFLQLDAVALLHAPIAAQHDDAHAAAGLPTLAQLLHDALDLGVTISACQSGLALTGIDAETLDKRVAVTGPVGWLQDVPGDARLVMV